LAAFYAVTQGLPSNPEEEEMAQEEVSQEGREVVGLWVSITDPRYASEINTDGTYRELYDEQVVSEGTWEILTTLENEGLDVDPTFDRQVFLKKIDGQDGETFYYQIPEQEEDRLVLVYLFGDVLMFERAVLNDGRDTL